MQPNARQKWTRLWPAQRRFKNGAGTARPWVLGANAHFDGDEPSDDPSPPRPLHFFEWTRLRLATAAIGVGATFGCLAQAITVSVTPSADTFVRSLAPGTNYGGTGALSVSGSAAVNELGQQNGLFDTLIRFPLAGIAASFDQSLGSNSWVLTSATLVLTEVGAPNNAIFNRGVGAFEVRWIASGSWDEGTGTPNTPTADGVAYQDLASVLDPAADVALGQFTNSGADGPVSLPLAVAGVLVSNVLAASDLNLHLTAASASVGFTFNSRNFGTSNAWPYLHLSAVTRPKASISSIQLRGTNQVTIQFNTVSNWTCVVQGADGLGVGSAGVWSNLFTLPANTFDSQAEFVDGTTNRQRLYRLLLSR